MTTTSVTWTPVQRGLFTAGIWADAPDGFGVFTAVGDTAGFVFDAATGQTLRFAMVGSQQRILEGPLIMDWTLNFRVGTLLGPGPSACAFELAYVPQAAAENYTTALPPFGRSEISLETFSVGVVPNLPNTIPVSISPNASQMSDLRALVTSRAAWSGRLALSLRQTLGNPLEIVAPSVSPVTLVTAQDLVFFSGLIGGPIGPGVRVVRDGRFAMPAFSNQLVSDGDQHGLFVRAGDWDPEDETASYRPRPGEGSINDEVPDL